MRESELQMEVECNNTGRYFLKDDEDEGLGIIGNESGCYIDDEDEDDGSEDGSETNFRADEGYDFTEQ